MQRIVVSKKNLIFQAYVMEASNFPKEMSMGINMRTCAFGKNNSLKSVCFTLKNQLLDTAVYYHGD